MIRTIIESNVFLYATAAVGMLGILFQIMVSRKYGQLIRETSGGRGEKRNFMKQLRFKYQTNRKRNGDNTNISVFVRRSIMDYKFMRLSIHQWRRMAGGLYLAAVTAAVVAGYYGTQLRPAAVHTDNLFWMAAAITAVSLVVWMWTDIPYKASYLQTALEDFLYHAGMAADYEEAGETAPEAETITAPAVIGMRKKKPVRETRAQRDKRELKESLSRETAAELEGDRKERNRELLRQMDEKEQERIIRDVLAEFLA